MLNKIYNPIKILFLLPYIQNTFHPILCILAIVLLPFCIRISYLFLYKTSRCVIELRGNEIVFWF
jgi:hypothetical protein